MMRFLTAIIFLGVALTLACGAGGAAPGERPSVILVVVDTLRADHLGCYGYGGPTSPRLDELAGEGVRFERLVSAAPWTLPSVVSLMTATWPSVHGAAIWEEGPRTIDSPLGIRGIDQRITTLAQAFRDGGYHTRAWVTNPFLTAGSGIERGFGEYLYRHYPEESGQAGAVIDEVIRWLDSDPAGPFFVYLHLNDPHQPHFPRPEHYPPLRPILGALPPGFDPSGWQGLTSIDPRSGPEQARLCRMKMAFYDAAVAYTDHHLGRLISRLRPERTGALSSGGTVLAVVSDHGEEFWDHSVIERERYADPRGAWGIGHGQSQYQELLRVPLLIAGPGLPPGTVVRHQGRSVDLAPTLLELAGIQRPPTMEGRSLRPLWSSDRPVSPGRDAFGESIAYGTERKAVVAGDWKYIVGVADGFEELYHLGQDPMELVNLAAREQARVDEMRRRLRQHLEDCAGRRQWSGERLGLQGRMVEELQALGYVE